jgi:FAD/FMN-containing dehydrogenase
VCDNILSYEVVLASGEIITTTGETHLELFRALKGGGRNFGIVTSFEIRCFEQGHFLGACVASPLINLDMQLDGFMALLDPDTFDKYAAVIISLSWHQARNSWMLFTNLEYTKSLPEGAEINILQCFRPFTEIERKFMDTMRVSTVGSFTNEMKYLYSAGMRNQFATTCIAAKRNVLDAVIET